MTSFKNKIISNDVMKVTNYNCDFLEFVPQMWMQV
jgi:hypothetical protein